MFEVFTKVFNAREHTSHQWRCIILNVSAYVRTVFINTICLMNDSFFTFHRMGYVSWMSASSHLLSRYANTHTAFYPRPSCMCMTCKFSTQEFLLTVSMSFQGHSFWHTFPCTNILEYILSCETSRVHCLHTCVICIFAHIILSCDDSLDFYVVRKRIRVR